MPIRFFATILLAAGLAAAKPINNLHFVHALTPRQDVSAQFDTCLNSGSGMISALAAVESRAQREVLQINADNLIIINIDVNNDENDRGRGDDKARDRQDGSGQDRGEDDSAAARKAEKDAATQQLMLKQVNQALIADQRDNAAKNEMDNVLRAVAATQERSDKSTVILVVQEVKINIEVEVQVDNKRRDKRKIDASVFKQEAIVANRGKQETETVMVYDPRTLTATNAAAATPEATATDAANAIRPAEVSATKTIEAVLYNARPTYTAIAEDPAALMRAALRATLEDRQRDENRAMDVELNIQIAVEVKVEIEKDNGRNNDRKADENNNDRDQDRERERQREEEQQKKEQEQKDKEQEKAENDRQEAEKQKQKQEWEKAEQEEQQKQDKANEDAQREEQEQAQAEAEQKTKAEQEDAQRDAKQQQDGGIKLTIVQ